MVPDYLKLEIDKAESAWDKQIGRLKQAEAKGFQPHKRGYLSVFVSSLGPKGWGYGEMVDAADSTRLSLGMETYRVAAPRFRGTWDHLPGNPEPNLVLYYSNEFWSMRRDRYRDSTGAIPTNSLLVTSSRNN